jgi:hypothetical protein
LGELTQTLFSGFCPSLMAVFICPLQVVKSLVKGRLLVTEDITIALSWASIVMAVVLVIPAFFK